MNSVPFHQIPIQAAIIDLDGTLVDTLGDFSAAIDAMLASLGHPPLHREAVAGFIGKGSEHLIRSVLARVGLPPVAYDAAWQAYQTAYRAINGQHSALYPGAAEGVAMLRDAGLRLACLTNKPTEFARALLRDKGLTDAFEVVFGGDAFEKKKPDPLPLLRTCEALGVAPAATLMIGDSINDALAARAAGCAVVLVTYGYNHGEPVHGIEADGYVDSIAEVPAKVNHRLRGPGEVPRMHG